ncbi:type II toxin-antitoxin system HicB family antitoxin [Aerophototrophica crusticola]|uniref:Type II toxin-antitoxin system HicB family antitoxin n=1 Tax=Aerophototrophica crusticola TaxID=1709002 RepID=A0A858R8F5_9PROT|nr:type II toxin-antitoxin system HicB family antitoxin [Rhodospirillaceae bacterium B3]
MRAYPARLDQDPETGGFAVTFRDVPEAITCGDTLEEAKLHAVDALETALSLYVEDRADLPTATPAEPGETLVPLSALGMAKAALYETMRAQGVGKAALARRLNCHLPQVDRLLDLTHASKLEQVETALAALGKRLVVDIADAA